ncbi:zinc ribbon domain-containing protein YjdM [Alcaligenes endophyticus]|uniref:Alkylphosphonate utilization protein n=1 Tax=Alcaligenes endophyticus TaxID=1929088 RepID=A0ABT8EL51_9BURK|nr:zinc ribbon domain-containing protein YjdM [Alcaligenes endophyticus]MCX5590714.1 zinc ribbon domain-containing protein YjdM [Alcaligenes endophyticus]MDN4121922.1 alkylphosphonate utilization protein [Alcaligenes endophyticus]
MSNFPPCPQCTLENTYHDGEQLVCADCGYEWQSETNDNTETDSDEIIVKDSNGNLLKAGDDVILIRDLKVKGSATLKKGAKAKNIRLVRGDHEVDCKIDGISYLLKAMYLKKA